ncbi:hypothetical protein GOODEAATRI_033910 [Goodea atripinnis]|uniref:Uncharacterized protein n=1 Tax=Goodea atripinnis TaxID=208336 RepID=A0ABV0NFW1_9TELE
MKKIKFAFGPVQTSGPKNFPGVKTPLSPSKDLLDLVREEPPTSCDPVELTVVCYTSWFFLHRHNGETQHVINGRTPLSNLLPARFKVRTTTPVAISNKSINPMN